jgi:hypothetical protein
MKPIDPVEELRTALSVLSRREIEAAWNAAAAASKAIGERNLAQRAEMAAFLLASVLHDIGGTTQRPHDLSDVLPAVESLATYVAGRMGVIAADMGD